MKKQLKPLLEELMAQQQPAINKDQFKQYVESFNSFGSQVYRDKSLKELAETIGAICDAAEPFITEETEDKFDNITVRRNLKHLKESGKLFRKTVDEIHTLQQRLESLYEEIGGTLGRYYDIKDVQR